MRQSACASSPCASRGSATLQPLKPLPLIVRYHPLAARRVAVMPGVKAYLESPLRLEKVNNNNLG